MVSFPALVAPYQRVPLVHDTTDLFDPETQDALDSRYAAAGSGVYVPPVRDTASKTTASLANNAQETGTVNVSAAFELYDVTADRACRVRLYHSTAQRDADAARGVGTFPTDTGPDHGCFLEVIFDTADTYTITTGARGWLASGVAVPITVDNLSGSTHTVAVSFTYLPTE